MKKRLLIFLILLALLTNSIAFGFSGYENKVKAYLLGDYETGEILESYNIDTPVEIASISKLLSYFVIMDEIKKGTMSLNDKIIIDKDTASITGSSYNLKAGEIYTVEKLLKAAIVISGNDATYALAKHVAGSEAEFVNLMRKKAKSLGLSNYEIYNCSGLPVNNNGLQNKMTTRDIFKLTRELLDTHPEVLELSKIPFISEPTRNFLEMNTNPLLKVFDGIDGLKTGYTGKAGYCFVATLNIEGEPRETENLKLIGIVMGSSSYDERTEVSRALLQYGKENYSKKVFLHKELPLKTIEVINGEPSEIKIYPEENFSKLINKKYNYDVEINIDNLEPPINEFTKLGRVTILENNKPIFTTNILNKDRVEKLDVFKIIFKFYEYLFREEELLFRSK
jgi:D-alanyl-D-alanine carboxypeptidase (penicillin-binding protein 5/6)